MSTHQVHVFISHSWNYSRDYETLAEWIFEHRWRSGQASIRFRNYSVPYINPILDMRSDRTLREAIHRHICRSHVIIIPTGMYANYSKWKVNRGCQSLWQADTRSRSAWRAANFEHSRTRRATVRRLERTFSCSCCMGTLLLRQLSGTNSTLLSLRLGQRT